MQVSDKSTDKILMLTGDLNSALVPWAVRYRVKDAVNYLFRVRDVRETLKDLSESTMRLVVGDHSLDEVLTQREAIASLAQEALQSALDAAETGLDINGIDLGRTNVPVKVQPSFNEVNSARQEREKLIYQAREKYNNVIPEAEGQAKKKIQEAEGYAIDRVKRAQGDAARFLDLYEEYAKAKEITRERLYLETMQILLTRLAGKYVIDADQKGVLPLLRLGEKGGQP
jgi:membrane protease subunit HflK